MRKNAFIIFLILFTAAVALPGWSCQHGRSKKKANNVEWVAKNRHHQQRLGGKSARAWRGLSRAAERSNGVEEVTETEIEKDTGDKTLDGSIPIKK